MAPIFEVDMSSIQAADLLKTYYMLYQEMKKDFVHKDDLKTILSANIVTVTVSGPTGTGNVQFPAMSTDVAAAAKGAAYEAVVRAGDVVKEAATSAIQKVLS